MMKKIEFQTLLLNGKYFVLLQNGDFKTSESFIIQR
jgi:hypothetical protein